MLCLVCSSLIEKPLSFSTFFHPSESITICETCSKQLVPITGTRCHYCSSLYKSGICPDCLEWKRLRPKLDTLDSNFSIFPYTPFIKSVFAEWKYRGDYELGQIFKPIIQEISRNVLKIDQATIVIPIPLSPERQHERSFNQAEMIAQWITPQLSTPIIRQNHEKQAKKSKYERITSENPFILRKSINKPVLLVDDIYTTGTTLRHASTILKESGCPRVDAFTLIRS